MRPFPLPALGIFGGFAGLWVHHRGAPAKVTEFRNVQHAASPSRVPFPDALGVELGEHRDDVPASGVVAEREVGPRKMIGVMF